jgi:hypothetical protein
VNRATAAWLASRGLKPETDEWYVSIELDDHATAPTARFNISIDAGGWSFCFEHAGKASRVRVTDDPVIQEGDDFELMRSIPNLEQIGVLLTGLERRFDVYFRRLHAEISTSIARAEPTIRLWVVACL